MTTNHISRRHPNGRHTRLQAHLTARLLSLSYAGFQRCALDLLHRMGYSDVSALGRHYFRGRNRHGGAELAAYTAPTATKLLVLGQLKHYQPNRSVQRRFIDELRGTMVRTGAKQGLLITTGAVPRVASLAATREPTRAYPISIIDGELLTRLLIRNDVGVYHAPGDGRPRIDRSYFARLADTTQPSQRSYL